MEQSDIQDIEMLLPRYCDGTVTEEERQLVETWLQSSEENRRIAEQVQLLYLSADAVHVMRKVDTEKALKTVRNRMVVKKTTSWEWIQRVAAILFIPLLIAFLIPYMTDRTSIAQIIEVRTNPGMTTKVVLPDSSVVFLNSESLLRYPAQFGKETREVTLNGEAYFEVAKDRKKRFIVSVPHRSRIEVLGTHFNVEAYEDDPDISTTLVEGQVCFLYEPSASAVKKVVMMPNQKLTYNSVDQDVQLSETSCLAEISWKDGKIIFSDTPLEEALNMLEKRFNVMFTVRNKSLMNNSFTGTFTEQRLERILEYFKISSKIRWHYLESADIEDEGRKIEVY